MVNKFGIVALLVAGSLWSGSARAQFTGNLTVEVNGLQSQEGNICFKVFRAVRVSPITTIVQ